MPSDTDDLEAVVADVINDLCELDNVHFREASVAGWRKVWKARKKLERAVEGD